MGPTLTRGDVTRADALAAFDAEGCGEPRVWGNGPGEAYGAHEHPWDKVLFCIEGSIVFTTDAGDLDLWAGDRLDSPGGDAPRREGGTDGVRVRGGLGAVRAGGT